MSAALVTQSASGQGDDRRASSVSVRARSENLMKCLRWLLGAQMTGIMVNKG